MDSNMTSAVLDNGLKVLVAGGAHRAAGVGLVLVQSRFERRGDRPHRRVALGRAHELQGHDQHPPRPGERHHRKIRRQLERLYVDRSDHLHGDGVDGRPRSHAVHRSRADGQLHLRSRRLRIGAHGHHFRAAGRRERSRHAARAGSHRGGLQGASVSASDDRLAFRSADDDARRSVSVLPPQLRSRTTRRSSSSATSIRTTSCAASRSSSARFPRARRPGASASSSPSSSASAASRSRARARPRI